MLRSSGARARRPRLPVLLVALALTLSACVPTLPRPRPVAFSMKDGRLAMVVNACPGWAPFDAKITEEGKDGNFGRSSWTSSDYRSSSNSEIPLDRIAWGHVSRKYDQQKNLMVEVFAKSGVYEMGFWYGSRLGDFGNSTHGLIAFDEKGQPRDITIEELSSTSTCRSAAT